MNLEEPLNSPKYDIADKHVKKLHNGYELDVKRSSSGHVLTNFPSTNLMPCPFTGPKMFWAGPNFLS